MNNRRHIASTGILVALLVSSSAWAQTAPAARPPSAGAAGTQYSLFCFAAEGRTTAYLSNVFDGAASNFSHVGPAFTQYLAGKYSFKGRAACTGGATPEQVKTLRDQEVAALHKQVANVIEISWTFDASAAPVTPAVAAANVRPAPVAPAPPQNPTAAGSAAAVARPRNPVPSVPVPSTAAPVVAATPRPVAAAPPTAPGSTTIYAYCISDESKPVIYVSDVFNTGMGNQTPDSTSFLNLMATAYNFADYLKSKYSYTASDEPGAGCLTHGDAALVQQNRQKWQAAQQAAKKQVVTATWKFTPDSMKLSSTPTPPPASTSTQTALPSGPGVLTWKQVVQKDQLTDETSTETVAVASIGKASAPSTLSVTTKCTSTGFRFIFSVSDNIHSPANPPFGWAKNDSGDNYIPMRIRIDSSAAHQTIAFADSDGDGPTATQYINAPVLLFYDARGIESATNNEIPVLGIPAFDGVFGALTRDASKAAAQKTEDEAAGSLSQLVNATSIRVELPLVDGQNPIVDINPRDKVLQPLIQKCSSKLK